MEQAYQARSVFLANLKMDRIFDPLRSDPLHRAAEKSRLEQVTRECYLPDPKQGDDIAYNTQE